MGNEFGAGLIGVLQPSDSGATTSRNSPARSSRRRRVGMFQSNRVVSGLSERSGPSLFHQRRECIFSLEFGRDGAWRSGLSRRPLPEYIRGGHRERDVQRGGDRFDGDCDPMKIVGSLDVRVILRRKVPEALIGRTETIVELSDLNLERRGKSNPKEQQKSEITASRGWPGLSAIHFVSSTK